MARRYNTGVSRLLLSVLAGLALALLFTASPRWRDRAGDGAGRGRSRGRLVSIATTGACSSPSSAWRCWRGSSPSSDCSRSASPSHSDLALGSLTGDQAYNVSRSLRTRDILRGFGGLTHYDYFVTTDEYGRTSYITPADSAAIRLRSVAIRVAGVERIDVRDRRGDPVPNAAAAIRNAARAASAWSSSWCLPSLFYASISVLKEPLYFLASSACLAAAIGLGRRRPAVSWIALARARRGLHLDSR